MRRVERGFVNRRQRQPSSHRPDSVLFLQWISRLSRSLTIGRDESNDVVLENPSASRFHARIEWRKRAFYLVDRSSNGTTVVSETGRVTTLRKDDLRIKGSGTFGVGGLRGVRPDEPIRFEVRGKRGRSKPKPKSNSTTGW